MSVELLPKKEFNTVVARQQQVRSVVHRAATAKAHAARSRLASAKKSRWRGRSSPPSRIEVSQGRVDSYIELIAPGKSAAAIEYGHVPSGVFAGTATRPPRGIAALRSIL